jgi:autotransporter-associated beta strand protein
MKTSNQSNAIRVAAMLLLGCLFSSQQAVAQTTNYFIFGSTTINSGGGPSNPANGATTINGASLAGGGTIVFDGVVANTADTSGDNWGAVELNAGGYLGVTSAQLGVLVRTGDTVTYPCALYYGGSGANTAFTGTTEVYSNRVRIELYVSTTGSTTNMGYLVEIDQGVTGTWTSSLSGTNLTFTGNSIALQFGANAANILFSQEPLPFLVTAPSPATITVATNLSATFTVAVSAGFNTKQCWRKNGVSIPGATNLTYTTPPAVAADNGAQFDIVVTNTLNTSMILTGAPPAVMTVRSGSGYIPFNFPTMTTIAGYGPVTDPGVAISGSTLQAGDIVVFDGILIPNGSQPSDAWTAINIAGSGYGNVTSAQLGVLCRQGTGPSQLFINGSGSTNPSPGGAPTNRVRIELYPSVSGSTTNMGWLVEIDQNLAGTFLPAITGTNLTFPNNTLPLTFGSSGGSSFVYQDPQSPVSIFTQPNPLQVVAVGAPVSVGVTVLGWSPAFQWRKNGAAIPNATNQTYTLAAATLADNGDKFTVVVSNRLNSLNVVTSTVANVSVLIPNNLSWYPTVDLTTWDTATQNWTTNGGTSQALFASGNNVTFDALGYNLGGSVVTITNEIDPNAVTVNATGSLTYQLGGAGTVNGQNLHLTSADNSGILGLQSAASFATVSIDAGSTLDVGYGGTDIPSFGANNITNSGTIDFQNNAGVLTVAGVITGSGPVIKDGTGTTVLSSTNSACTIGAINSGALLIASTPNPGTIDNEAELQPVSSANVLVIHNVVTGSGHYAFTGFQTTILTGVSTFTGQNRLAWGPVIVDNPQALGDATAGATAVTGADNLGGLYLSNNITWTQPLELNPREESGVEATAPHISNWSGTNLITSPLSFATGQGGSEINVEATTGQLTIDASSTLVNNANANTNDLNLQGSAIGIWNGILVDGTTALNVVKRGPGTWTLGGADTYSGTTTVASGTLLVTNSLSATAGVSVQMGATLGGNGAVIAGPVSVAGGGTLVPGLPGKNGAGMLTINNSLTLAAGSYTSMNLKKSAATNDVITGINALTYGGTLVVSNLSGTLAVGDAFPLFSATSYSGTFASISPPTPGSGLAWNTSTLAVDGKLRIAVGNTVPTNSIPIVATVVGGNTLQLTWPTDHIGWILEVQTNSLNAGLGTNWVRNSTSSSTNQVLIPLVPANGSVFYRLINQ